MKKKSPEVIEAVEDFTPSDLLKYDLPEELQKKRTLDAGDAVKLLISLGLVAQGSIPLEVLASEDILYTPCLSEDLFAICFFDR